MMAPDSSAGESEDEGDEQWDDEEDSDTDPIPISGALFDGDAEEEEDFDEAPSFTARPPTKKRKNGANSFSTKQFKKIDPSVQRQQKLPRGISVNRPLTKMQKKRADEAEQKANRGKGGAKVEGRARYEDLQANKDAKDVGGAKGGAGGGGQKGGDKKRGARGKGGKGKK